MQSRENHKENQQVRFYIVSLSDLTSRAEEISALVMERYRQRYLTTKFRPDALCALASGFLLWNVLGVKTDQQLLETTDGKLFLRDQSAYFSISHSGDYAVLAVSEEDLGVDIEKIDTIDLLAVQKMYGRAYPFPKGIVKDKELQARFWTKLEAEAKAFGSGFCAETALFLDTYEIRHLKYKEHMITVASKQPFSISVKEIRL